jgi:hypothetical protein
LIIWQVRGIQRYFNPMLRLKGLSVGIRQLADKMFSYLRFAHASAI